MGWHRFSSVLTSIKLAAISSAVRGIEMIARSKTTNDFDELSARMDAWPRSWAGVDADLKVGKGLVALLRPFLAHLGTTNLAHRTIRRHFTNLWVIGGEVIRDVNDDDALRRLTAARLLERPIENGYAPFARDATEQQQQSCDTTARKLRAFLSRA
jgi:hypothetical protein